MHFHIESCIQLGSQCNVGSPHFLAVSDIGTDNYIIYSYIPADSGPEGDSVEMYFLLRELEFLYEDTATEIDRT
jgi:hypothetical protein